jgi:hypothetical protein
MMASGKMDLFGDYALQAIANTIAGDIRSDLKARIMSIIEPEIDAAVDRAVRSLKPRIETHADFAAGATILKVITEKRTPK